MFTGVAYFFLSHGNFAHFFGGSRINASNFDIAVRPYKRKE